MKPRVPGKPIKFESDYDFEQANSKFEELFAKLKVGDGSNANPEDNKIEQQVIYFFLFLLFCTFVFFGIIIITIISYLFYLDCGVRCELIVVIF